MHVPVQKKFKIKKREEFCMFVVCTSSCMWLIFHSQLILLIVKFLFEFSHCSIILFYFQGQISNSESTRRWRCICKVVCMTKLFLPAKTTLDYIDPYTHAWLKFHLACKGYMFHIFNWFDFQISAPFFDLIERLLLLLGQRSCKYRVACKIVVAQKLYTKYKQFQYNTQIETQSFFIKNFTQRLHKYFKQLETSYLFQ